MLSGPWIARQTLDACHVTRYIGLVIKSFADKQTQQLYLTGNARQEFLADVAKRAARKLEQVERG